MPRTTHTLRRVERPGRTPYWQAWIGGKPRYLGRSKRDAEKRLRQLLAEAPTPTVTAPRTVTGLIAAFNAVHEVKMTDWAAGAWRRFAGSMPLGEIEADHLERLYAGLKKERFRRLGPNGEPGSPRAYSAETIRKYLRAAHAALHWAREQGWTGVDAKMPKTQTPRRVPRDLRPVDVAAVLASLREPARSIIAFLTYTGARVEEACRLRWDWFRPDGLGRFVIPPESHKTGQKTGEPRTLYLTPEARAIVDGAKRQGEIVFPASHGGEYTASGLRAVTRRHGLKRPFDLRPTFATTALARGVPLHVVSQLLGHRSIVTTQRYARTRSETALAAAASLTDLLAGGGESEQPGRLKSAAVR